MTARSRHVLLTRPHADSLALAAEVEARGFIPFIEPLLTVMPVDHDSPDLRSYEGIVLTSAHAATHFKPAHKDITVYAVGDHTAQAARAAGYRHVISASGDADDLTALISGVTGKLLYVRGEDISRPLQPEMDELTVYRAVPASALSLECAAHLQSGVFSHALFFSGRSAQTFVDLIHRNAQEGAVSGINALCIGAGMVKSLSVLPWHRIDVAKTPDRAAMLDLLTR